MIFNKEVNRGNVCLGKNSCVLIRIDTTHQDITDYAPKWSRSPICSDRNGIQLEGEDTEEWRTDRSTREGTNPVETCRSSRRNTWAEVWEFLFDSSHSWVNEQESERNRRLPPKCIHNCRSCEYLRDYPRGRIIIVTRSLPFVDLQVLFSSWKQQ